MSEEDDDYTQRFDKGDFLQHKNPYKGESELLIVDIDEKHKAYRCATIKGKHRSKPDFDNHYGLYFEKANRSYQKVG